MLFNKSAVLFSALALCNVVVAAQPPACLLSVVGSQPKPADFKAICVKNADKVQESISDRCDDEKKEALKFYANTCEANGHKVEVSSSSSSSSSSSTTTSGSQSTSTGKSSQTTSSSSSSSSGSGSGSDSGSGSSSSADSSSSPSPSAPVSAGASDRQFSAAAFAAVVFVGFAATM